MFRNILRFYNEELLAPRPTPKLEDHYLSSYSIYLTYSQLLSIPGGHSSVHNLDIPCCGDRDPLVMEVHVPCSKLVKAYVNKMKHQFPAYSFISVHVGNIFHIWLSNHMFIWGSWYYHHPQVSTWNSIWKIKIYHITVLGLVRWWARITKCYLLQ